MDGPTEKDPLTTNNKKRTQKITIIPQSIKIELQAIIIGQKPNSPKERSWPIELIKLCQTVLFCSRTSRNNQSNFYSSTHPIEGRS